MGEQLSLRKRSPQPASSAAFVLSLPISRVFSSISRPSLTARLRRASAPKAKSPSSIQHVNILKPPEAMPSTVRPWGTPRKASASRTLT